VQAQYAILKRDDIVQRQKKAISEVTSILGLNEDEATRVLRKFKWCARLMWHDAMGRARQGGVGLCTYSWQRVAARAAGLQTTPVDCVCRRSSSRHPLNRRALPSPPPPLCLTPRDVNRVNEEWFSDVEAVRKAVGILEEPAPEGPGESSKVGASGWCGPEPVGKWGWMSVDYEVQSQFVFDSCNVAAVQRMNHCCCERLHVARWLGGCAAWPLRPLSAGTILGVVFGRGRAVGATCTA
jgi:hypothetical protein